MERFKFRNLVDPFRPSRKCGTEVAAIMALSSMSAMASAASASQANSTQQAALDQSKEENALNRQFQARQATIARAYNTSERVAQQNYQTGQIENLMQYNKQLQSPVYQSQQLQAAGINPSVYFSNHSTFNGGATPGANAPSGPGVSGVPTGASGLPGITPVVPDWASSMMVGANIAKTMSEAGMNKSQTDLILQKVFTEQLVQDTMKIDNMFKQAKYPAEVKKLWTEIKSEIVKQGLMEWQGKKYKSDIDVNESIQKLNKALENKNDQESLLLKRQLWELTDNYGLRKEVIASEGAKNRGQAAQGFAIAEHEREEAKNARFYNLINEENRETIVSRIQSEADKAGQEARLDKYKVGLIKELTRKFEKENDWYVANQILDRIQQIAGDVIDLKRIEVAGMPTETVHSESTSVSDNSGYRSTTTKKSSNLRKKRR